MLADWETMSIDERLDLHQLMQSVLREKLMIKKELLDDRSRQLNGPSDGGKDDLRP
jgi:hypothetical protein